MKVTFVGPVGLFMAAMSMLGLVWLMVAVFSFFDPLTGVENHALSPVHFGRSLKQQFDK